MGFAFVLEEDSSEEWGVFADMVHGETRFDGFGKVVSLSSGGRVLAVGAPGGRRVEVFQVFSSLTSWGKVAADLGGEYQFGFSISLSSNGLLLAVGPPLFRANFV